MKNKVSSILWGAIFIIAGVGFVGNAFNIWNFELFFSGWWTLFLIVPSVVSVFTNGPKPFSLSIFIIGILLFLSCQGIFDYSVIEKLIVPVVFIVIGFCIMGNALGFKRDKKEKIESFHAEGVKDYSAAFGGQTIVYSENEVFEGATINAIFGGVDLDLRSCIINSDVVIDCTTIFGGADIYIPSDVNVKITSTPIFGGVSNSKRKNNFVESAPTVYINAVCMFGGVDVK